MTPTKSEFGPTVIDMSSLETAWIVLAEDAVDEGARVVCFTRKEAEAVEAVDMLQRAQKDGAPIPLDPLMRASTTPDICGVSGTRYWHETARRWPSFDERAARGGDPR